MKREGRLSTANSSSNLSTNSSTNLSSKEEPQVSNPKPVIARVLPMKHSYNHELQRSENSNSASSMQCSSSSESSVLCKPIPNKVVKETKDSEKNILRENGSTTAAVLKVIVYVFILQLL